MGVLSFFTEHFKYRHKNMRWVGFDLKAYDTSIGQLFLEVYAAMTASYYKFRNAQDKQLFIALLKEIITRLAAKTTCMLSGIWRVIFGVMASGSIETSHGDSWILCFVYHCFYVYLMLSDMEFRAAVADIIARGELPMGIYGDDNLKGFNKRLKKWFTYERISKFFKDWANFEIRDFKIMKRFLTVPNFQGNIKEEGVVFLQKYIIETPQQYLGPGAPLVVQWRPAITSIRKFGKGGSGDKRSDLDYLLSNRAMVFDNPCNPVIWEFSANFEIFISKRTKATPETLREVLTSRQGSVFKALKKNHLYEQDLVDRFPTVARVKQLLVVDREKYNASLYADIWSDDYQTETKSELG